MRCSEADRRETVLIGRGSQLVRIPRKDWNDQLARVPERHAQLLKFMTREHHLVRNFTVRELPRVGRPIESFEIAERLQLPFGRVVDILADLEKNLFFLVRNEAGAVSWAYPLTVDETPHRLEFAGGERLFAA